jgi:hypothetical protein
MVKNNSLNLDFVNEIKKYDLNDPHQAHQVSELLELEKVVAHDYEKT